MRFKTPLSRRMRQADQLRQRYREDETYRLHKVNCSRAAKGKPAIAGIDQIGANVVPGQFLPRRRDGRWLPHA